MRVRRRATKQVAGKTVLWTDEETHQRLVGDMAYDPISVYTDEATTHASVDQSHRLR